MHVTATCAAMVQPVFPRVKTTRVSVHSDFPAPVVGTVARVCWRCLVRTVGLASMVQMTLTCASVCLDFLDTTVKIVVLAY